MREPAITQHYWNQYRVAPAKPSDKPRREKPSFMDIYRAQTSKVERKVHIGVMLLLAANIVNQAGKGMGWW